MAIPRSDIDQILERVRSEGASPRGKLKIFFGAMAGVGKTYAMLEAARARKKEGVDVVVGYVETHKRSETEALLEGLEILPERKVVYKNITIREFDIDLALQRRPAAILVDELAHSNPPGARNLKRWQDIDELLDAGIDVYTTMNVQHCESANDVVAGITGVTVRETVPDTFIEKADDIELVDLPPEDLLKRLQEGKVYLGDQAERAVQNFFQIGNLIALRQLALQYTSRVVDVKMRSYKQAHSISDVWNVRDRFLVSISPSPQAMGLIRAGKRIASSMGVDWIVAYVEIPSSSQSAKDRARISEMMRFAEKLGATTVTLSGQEVAETLITYARSRNVTKIIIGKPGKPRWYEYVSGSVIDALARKCGKIDVYLLSGDTDEQQADIGLRPSRPFPWAGFFWSTAVIAVCSAVCKIFSGYLDQENIVMIYLLAIVGLAYRYGLRVSMIASLMSVLAFDYLFVQPLYTFVVADIKRDLITFGVMLSVGFAISFLTSRLRQQTISMRLRENRTQALYDLTKELSKTSDLKELFQVGAYQAQKYFKCPVVIFWANKKERLEVAVDSSRGISEDEKERAVAEWVYAHKKIAGKNTDTLPSSRGIYLPLLGSERVVGVIGLFSQGPDQFADPEQLHMFEMFANQTALAAEGAEFAAEAVKAESDIENARLRNMLLSTFSLDLPKPLEVISKAASELMTPGTCVDAPKRDELIKMIQNETNRLNKLSEEMIDIIKSEKESE